jgi:hypothetical protein
MNDITLNSALLYRGAYYRIYTLSLTVLSYYLLLFLRPSYTSVHIYTTHNSLALDAFPNSISALIQVQILVSY